MSGLPAVVHHMPDDDAIDHEARADCVCGPRREPVGTRRVGWHGGQQVFVFVHERLAPQISTEGDNHVQ